MKHLFTFYLFLSSSFLVANSLQELKEQGLAEKNAIRLHLGCGENKMAGYINIDFPLEDHSVQKTQAADYTHDITTLRFPENSVDEIRNHHMFEHFSRPVALALLTAWHHWLKEGGKLHIETPDFEKSIQQLVSNEYDYDRKQLIIRHIFGSQEADWALHYDAWYDEKYRHILAKFGFAEIDTNHTEYKDICNIHVVAWKAKSISLEELKQLSLAILSQSLVDNSKSEKQMLQVWYKEYLKALDLLIL